MQSRLPRPASPARPWTGRARWSISFGLVTLALLGVAGQGAEAQRAPLARPQPPAASSVRKRPPLDFTPGHPRLDIPLSDRLAAPVAIDSLGRARYVTDDGVLSLADVDGAVRWSLLLGPPRGAPTVGTDGTCYVTSADQHLYAVDAGGRLLWRQPLGGMPRGGATMLDGDLAVAVDVGALRTYALENGAPRRTLGLGAPPASAPVAIRPGRLAVPTVDGQVVSLEGTAGLRVRIDDGAAIGGLAVDHRGDLYAGSAGGWLARVGPEGRVVWKIATGGPVRRSPAIDAAGTLYVVVGEGAVIAVEPDRGRVRWRKKLGATVVGGPLVADDDTVFFSVQGEPSPALLGGAPSGHTVAGGIVGLTPAGRRSIWIELPSAPTPGLTLANHQLWLGTRDLTLRRLTVSATGLARSPWPKSRAGLANRGAVLVRSVAGTE